MEDWRIARRVVAECRQSDIGGPGRQVSGIQGTSCSGRSSPARTAQGDNRQYSSAKSRAGRRSWCQVAWYTYALIGRIGARYTTFSFSRTACKMSRRPSLVRPLARAIPRSTSRAARRAQSTFADGAGSNSSTNRGLQYAGVVSCQVACGRLRADELGRDRARISVLFHPAHLS